MQGRRAAAQCSLPSGNPYVASDARRSPTPLPALRKASSNPSATRGRRVGLNAKAARGMLQWVPAPTCCRPGVRHHRTSGHLDGSFWPKVQVSPAGLHDKASRQSDGCPKACRRLLHASPQPRRFCQWCRESAASGTKARIGKEPWRQACRIVPAAPPGRKGVHSKRMPSHWQARSQNMPRLAGLDVKVGRVFGGSSDPQGYPLNDFDSLRRHHVDLGRIVGEKAH